MIKICMSVTSHPLYPPPPVTNCHTFSDPPSSVTYFMDYLLLYKCLITLTITTRREWVNRNNYSAPSMFYVLHGHGRVCISGGGTCMQKPGCEEQSLP